MRACSTGQMASGAFPWHDAAKAMTYIILPQAIGRGAADRQLRGRPA
jgi:hypothetical protein